MEIEREGQCHCVHRLTGCPNLVMMEGSFRFEGNANWRSLFLESIALFAKGAPTLNEHVNFPFTLEWGSQKLKVHILMKECHTKFSELFSHGSWVWQDCLPPFFLRPLSEERWITSDESCMIHWNDRVMRRRFHPRVLPMVGRKSVVRLLAFDESIWRHRHLTRDRRLSLTVDHNFTSDSEKRCF